MPYNFDRIIDRRETNSYKWNVSKDELPMWVADMDFNTAPAVIEAIEKRVRQGAFGYTNVSEDFKLSIVTWWKRRHDWEIEKEWILFCTGAVPAISSIVRKMTEELDNIVLLSPVYNIFYHSILNNNRTVLASELRYKNGEYTIDFPDLEEKLANKATKLMIFCNPHNPIGKVWDKETLQRVGDLCVKYEVLLISDELHCDLTHKGFTYTPMASISEEIARQTITCVSPTKAFNLAGIQTSAIIIPNSRHRKLIERGINTDEVAEPNAIAIPATIAAFDEGEEWLEELVNYLEENKNLLYEKLESYFPEIKVVPAEATYLAWLDCSNLTDDTEFLCRYIREKTRLYLSEGEIFGGNGDQFIRWNYACSRSILMKGIQRFIIGVELYKKRNQS